VFFRVWELTCQYQDDGDRVEFFDIGDILKLVLRGRSYPPP